MYKLDTIHTLSRDNARVLLNTQTLESCLVLVGYYVSSIINLNINFNFLKIIVKAQSFKCLYEIKCMMLKLEYHLNIAKQIIMWLKNLNSCYTFASNKII